MVDVIFRFNYCTNLPLLAGDGADDDVMRMMMMTMMMMVLMMMVMVMVMMMESRGVACTGVVPKQPA